MHNVLAAAAVVALLSTAALACEQRTAAATQEAGASEVLLAQAIQQRDPAARPGREPQPETSAGDKSALPATPDRAAASTNQPPTVEQKEEVQKLGQKAK